ncbi:hypothetical protein, variant 1 [Aphanomyces astaci]|uniref:RCC1-like domain-containing protein n=1 Tax=Aphanomyces astaci TaxID=112090 RepID=W4FN48_APHAT|nr:hypothetical protein, variant 1 [Aphanomyces astaci]ETV68259.1 hypothetical protein, variant 1 [Aphanomyces astaci]|eukprot:XP_009842201.1 hypothetical protein, variant 1 [Aphanomyces astaci]
MFRHLVRTVALPLSGAVLAASSFSHNKGTAHRVPSKTDGARVFSWGSNGFGQLGQGHEVDLSTPTPIKIDRAAQSVACGGNSSAIVTTEGHVYTFGAGGSARLGHGDAIDTPNVSTPQLLEVPDLVFQKVAIGEYHMAALTADYRLFTWGRHNSPQLGHANVARGFPNEVAELRGNVQDIACGRQHSVAITTDGKLYVWGLGHEGALGHGDKANVDRPKLVAALAKESIVQAACGREYTLALTKEGVVYAWGANDYGQLGVAGSMRYQRTPLPVTSLDGLDVVQVAAGEYHSAALTASGQVYTWGLGKDGQLGLGTNDDRNIPRKLSELDGLHIVQVACGGGHTVCVSADGNLWVFGRGRSGQLGRGDQLESIAAYRNTPVQVQLPLKQRASQVTCGRDHTLAI